MAKTEVAEVKNTAVGDVGDFDQFAGQGFENVGSDDLLVPRLTILQQLSPQLKKKDVQYIESAEEGDICEVGTGQLFKGSVLFLPVYYKKVYIEWAPRSSGKGIVEIHDSPETLDRTTPDDKGRPVLENGNYIGETAQWFGLNLTAGRQRCFIGMASTQLKRSRKWMTMATGEKLQRADGSEFTPPLWYRSYVLGAADDGNAEGDWKSWTIERGPAMPELDVGVDWKTIKAEAIEFRESLVRGDAKGDMRDVSPAEGESDEGAM